MAYNEEWRLNARDRDENENEDIMMQYHSMVFSKFLESMTNPKPDSSGKPPKDTEEEEDKDKTIPWGKNGEEPPLFIGS
ncbi:MAG: hypothetical protein GOVbin962_9 [Prokaryotic dsDNA virus sp.]|nr:MAG: hypothetical protein GOVbin962_9 [Prokaryotic dsDNA virus sp.]|tara:strand:- start:33034 stop:33270 length:237 start_codon:yes stop_codon:yes gene_type:complete